jgi:prepilin-type processing-associated H-X9-DG protein
MLFGDCGTRAAEGGGPVDHSAILMYSASTWVGGGTVAGTMDAIFLTTWQSPKMPLERNQGDRHNDTLNIAYADGHAGNSGPTDFENIYLSPHLD